MVFGRVDFAKCRMAFSFDSVCDSTGPKKIKTDMSGNLPAFGWSLVHFNPFSEVGGQHSFVITLLDPHKNGVILTGLHGRGLTRFYTKLISNGLSDQPLSAEEIRGLKEALLKLR